MAATLINPRATSVNATATVNVGASTIDAWVKGATLTLPAGLWVVCASAHFPSGGSGTRNVGCCIYSGSTNWEQQRVFCAANAWTSLTPCTVLNLTEPTEVSVRVGSSSAVSNTNTIIRCAKVA